MSILSVYPPRVINDDAQTTIIAFELNGAKSVYKLYDCENVKEINCEYIPSGKFIINNNTGVFGHTLKITETNEIGQFIGQSNEFVVGRRTIGKEAWNDIQVIKPEIIMS